MNIGADTPPSSPHLQRGEYLRPLTEEESESLKSKFQDLMVAELLPTLSENLRGLAEARRGIAAADTKIAAADTKIAAADTKITVADTKIAAADTKIAAADTKIAQGMTEMFYTIFKGKTDPASKDLPAQEINRLFQAYLADGSFSAGSSPEGEAYCRINSMRPVTKYLKDHPNVALCDFRPFKAEIYDIPTLAEYLKHSKVKGIALKKSVSEEAKASLAAAVVARNGGLKVQYFA